MKKHGISKYHSWNNAEGFLNSGARFCNADATEVFQIFDRINSAKAPSLSNWFSSNPSDALDAFTMNVVDKDKFNALDAECQSTNGQGIVDFLSSFLSPDQMTTINQIVAGLK